MSNPHLQAKINEIYASGMTISEIIELAVLKDVEIVRLESENAVLREAIEGAHNALIELPYAEAIETALSVLGEALGGISDGE